MDHEPSDRQVANDPMEDKAHAAGDDRMKAWDTPFRQVFERSAEAVLILGGTQIVAGNQAAARMFRFPRPEDFNGRQPSQISPPTQPDGCVSSEKADEMIRQAVVQGSHSFEWLHLRADGEVFQAEVMLTPFLAGDELQIYTVIRDVSERQQAQQQLAEQEARYSSMVSNVPGAVYRCAMDEHWTMQYLSEAVEGLTGYPASELIENRVRSYGSLIHPDDEQCVNDEILAAVAANEAWNIEYRIRRADGAIRWVYEAGRSVRDTAGHVAWLDGAIFDIHDRKMIEMLVAQEERQLEEALHVGKMAYWEFDVASQTFTFNPQWYNLFRTQPERPGDYRMSAAYFAQHFVHPDSAASVGQTIGRAIQTDDPEFFYEEEAHIIFGDGVEGYVLLRLRVQKDEQGRTVKLYGTNQDITDRKQAEIRLLEEEHQLEEALRLGKMAYWEFDVTSQVFLFNPQWYNLFRTQPERPGDYRMSAAHFAQHFVHPDSAASVGQTIGRAIQTDDPEFLYEEEAHIIFGDGVDGYVLLRLRVQKDEQGRTVKLYGTNQDITDRKQAELDLAREQTLLRTLIDSLPDNIFAKDEHGHFLLNNLAHLQTLGLQNQAQAYGKTDLDIFPGEDGQKYYQDDIAVVTTGQAQLNYEETVLDRDTGEQHWIVTSKVPLRDHLGRVVGLVGINRDVTSRKLAEVQLERRANELATVAQVSTTIATELEPQTLLQAVVDLTRQSFKLYHAHIYLLDEARQRLTLVAGAGEVGQRMVAQDWHIPLDRYRSLVVQTATSRKGVTVNDVRQEVDFLPNPLLPDTRSELAVPLLVGDQILGVLDVQSELVGRFSDEDVQVLSILAGQVAVALQNARAYEERTRILATVEDLVQQRTEQLTESRQMLQTVLDHFPGLVFWKDSSLAYMGGNRAFLESMGVTELSQLVGKTDAELLPSAEDASYYNSIDRRVIESGLGQFGIIDQRTAPDGSPIWFEINKLPLRNAAGEVVGVMGTTIDVTERNQAEQAILQEKSFSETIVNSLPGVFYLFDPTGRMVRWNKNFEDVLGYTTDEIRQKNVIEVLAPEDRERTAAAIGRTFTEGRAEIEASLYTRKGERISYYLTGLRMTSGEEMYLVGTGQDITERKRADEALAQSRERSQALVEAIPDMIFRLDQAGVFIDFKAEKGQELLLQPELFLGKKLAEVMPPHVSAAALESVEQARQSGQAQMFEYDLEYPEGVQSFEARLVVSSAGDESVAIIRNITERKRLAQEVRSAFERRGHQVQVGTEIAQEIASALDLGDLFKRVVTLVKEQFGYYHTQILRYEAGQDAVVLVNGYGEVGQQMLVDGHWLPMGAGLIGSAAATGQTMLRTSLQDDPEWQPHPLLPHTKGEIAVPIKLRDQVLGVLDVQSDQPSALGEDDRLLLEGLCGQIAVAIEDTRLRQEMTERLNELNKLYRATSREGWQSFREETQTALGYIYDHVSLEPLQTGLAPAIARPTPAGDLAQSAESGLAQPAEGGLAQPAEGGLAVDPNRISIAATPLAVRGEVIGALGVFDDPQRPLTEDERQLIEQVSEQVAQALESARLFDQTQSVLAQTQSLYTGSARLVSAANLDEVLHAFVGTTILGDLDQVIVELFDRPWTNLPPAVMLNAAVWDHSGANLEPVGTTYVLNDFPFLSRLDREAPLVVEDVLLDERVDEATRSMLINQLNLRGLVFWPLIAGGEWFGLLAAQSHEPLRLAHNDIRNISSLIGQASVVIQGLRLQEDMRERVRELTSLQRLMSREAWMAYQAQALGTSGYLFDRVNLNPFSSEGRGGNGGGQMPGMDTAVTTSLQVRGEAIGVLGVAPESGRTLSLEEESFLQAVSEQVAQALERARLMEQTQKSAVELQAVAEVSTTTATILDPQELLQQVVDLTRSRFGLYHAHIYLLDDAGENLVLAVGAGEAGKAMTSEGWYIPVDQPDSLVAWVAQERRGKIIADVRQESGYLVNSLLPDTLSELAVPMVIANRLLGVFDVQANTINRFTEEDIRTYNTLAAQIAVALQNAKLYAEQLATVERLRELDNMKSAFLANMSHELRTPLNSILGFTQVIIEGLDGPLTDLMVSDLELIEKNGKHLLNLINDVLDMAKIEAGRLSLSPEPVNLYDMMDEVIMTNAALARDKNLFVNLDADPAGDWVVLADHVRIRQILINLMGNSIKFTETGGITITLNKHWAMENSDQDRVQVRLRDTGIGVPESKLEDIFEAFSQVDSSTTRKAGGTGLGLPISRRLVELHGGKLWAESEGPGRGSTFIMELPVSRVE